MYLIEILILTGTVLYLLYKWGTSAYDHWAKQGVDYIKPKVPFVGSSWGFVVRKFHPADGTKEFYDAFPNSKLGGFFALSQPWLVLRDPDVLKTVMVKDFDHFVDRNPLGTKDREALLMGKDLLSSRGQEWRNLRNTLSPAFTSAKIKTIFHFVNKCGEQLTDYIEEELKNQKSGEKVIEEDFKGLFTRFSNDVIATAAFGLQVDSLKDKNNEFYTHAMQTIEFGLVAVIRFMLIIIVPRITKFFNFKFLSGKVINYFQGLIINTIKVREENNVVRNDVIHLMLEARKGTLKADNESEVVAKGKRIELSDTDIASQVMLFFFAGFETVSTALCFMIHELAVHPDVQTRLRKEIDEVLKADNGEVTYDALTQRMKYLDMVVSESLRKWPPMFTSEREVSKAYTFKMDGVPEAKLERGDMVLIPIYAIHRDPNNYPDPEKFDPERFNDENKSKIKPYTYLPFGAGPRSCIGNRFALMETKMCLVHVLRKFVILPTENTKVQLKLDRKNAAALYPEGGFRYKIKLRDDLPNGI